MVEDTSGSGTSDNKHIASEHGLTCISWNDCPFEPAKLAVGGYSKRAVVLSLERNQLREVLFILASVVLSINDLHNIGMCFGGALESCP